jgi:LacI family transcriptional regulator
VAESSRVVRVTIEDVARAAGVSRQTVSRALNDKSEIAPETRRRVLAVVEELDYRPNMFARGMKTNRSDAIGLIVSDISNPFYPAVARGVFDAAEATGRRVVVYNTDAGAEREQAALDDLYARGADGAVGFFYALEESVLAEHGRRLPLVIADRRLAGAGLPSVTSDFGAGVTAAVEHLLASGHRRIGMLDSSVGVAVDERRIAFVDTLAARGVRGFDAPIVEAPPTIAGGAAALGELLAAHPSVTAVFAFNDLMAFGAIQTASRLGRSIPGECAIVGFDDLAFAQFVHPALTTVHTDKYAQGRTLVEVLTAGPQADSGTTAPRVVLPATLARRASA